MTVRETGRDALWRVEAGVLAAAVWVMRALGLRAASAVGGALARTVGPWLPVSRVAHENLRRAMPELDTTARRRVVRGVWDNLGRTVAELPHVGGLAETDAGPGFEGVGLEHFDAVVARGGPVLLISGHLGNWEALPVASQLHGLPFGSFYRAPPNPYIDAMLKRLRGGVTGSTTPLFAKGAVGARQAMAYFRAGGTLGILFDQKANDGIAATLFGRPAMTSSAAAVFALRSKCPVLFCWSVRLGPGRFRVVVLPPETLPDTGDRTTDALALTQTLNDRLEAAIRAHPDQWLWLHRRWPKD